MSILKKNFFCHKIDNFVVKMFAKIKQKIFLKGIIRILLKKVHKYGY